MIDKGRLMIWEFAVLFWIYDSDVFSVVVVACCRVLGCHVVVLGWGSADGRQGGSM